MDADPELDVTLSNGRRVVTYQIAALDRDLRTGTAAAPLIARRAPTEKGASANERSRPATGGAPSCTIAPRSPRTAVSASADGSGSSRRARRGLRHHDPFARRSCPRPDAQALGSHGPRAPPHPCSSLVESIE